MDNWKLYPLELYALIITTPDLTAYQISDGSNITPFVPAATEDIDIEIIVPELLFKCEDVFDVKNRYEFNPLNTDDGKATNANTVTDKKEISQEIHKMLNDAGPEVEKLYTAIKKIGFSGKKTVTAVQYRDAVMKCFRGNRKNFNMIIESYLSDWNLYSFRPGQGKMDFIGKILLEIARDRNLGIGNFQKIYQMYLSTKRLKKSRK